MSNKVRKIILPAVSYFTAMVAPTAALAQGNQLVPNEIKGIDNIVAVVRAIIQFILVIAFVLAFIMLLIGGIRWITAGGDEKAVGSARNMITAALIGLVIVLVAYALIKLVETFFGVNIISQGVTIPRVER
ncbi:MAG: hypothetical protein Q8P25_00065 [Candidatus Curtissbacteria bacterium]|nr:hypothetical protein [Candidatus Curtissbacteria bacterium]